MGTLVFSAVHRKIGIGGIQYCADVLFWGGALVPRPVYSEVGSMVTLLPFVDAVISSELGSKRIVHALKSQVHGYTTLDQFVYTCSHQRALSYGQIL
jgi:hypothetical protein